MPSSSWSCRRVRGRCTWECGSAATGGLVCIGYGVWVIGRHAHLSEIATREWVLAGVLVGGGLLLWFIAAGIDGELENRAEEEALERQARKLKEVMLRDDL